MIFGLTKLLTLENVLYADRIQAVLGTPNGDELSPQECLEAIDPGIEVCVQFNDTPSNRLSFLYYRNPNIFGLCVVQLPKYARWENCRKAWSKSDAMLNGWIDNRFEQENIDGNFSKFVEEGVYKQKIMPDHSRPSNEAVFLAMIKSSPHPELDKVKMVLGLGGYKDLTGPNSLIAKKSEYFVEGKLKFITVPDRKPDSSGFDD